MSDDLARQRAREDARVERIATVAALVALVAVIAFAMLGTVIG